MLIKVKWKNKRATGSVSNLYLSVFLPKIRRTPKIFSNVYLKNSKTG